MEMTMTNIDAETIIAGLGGKQSNGKCFCPAHDDKNTANLTVTQRGDKVLVKCWAGCPQEAVIEALRERGLWGPQGNDRPRQARSARHDPPDEYERWYKAWQILRTARLAGTEPPTEYFRGRGIENVPANAMLLPTEDAVRLTGKRFPAMVFPITDERGIQGAHLTFLTKEQKENAKDKDGKNVRRLFGPTKGGFVILGASDPDKPLLVAEGIEDALSAAQLTGLPAIATTGTANLKAVNPPPCSEIIICGDNDDPGREAAEAAAGRLASAARKVRIAIPREHKDWNEALSDPHADHDRLRQQILRAPEFEPTQVTSLGMHEFMDLAFPPRQRLMHPWLATTGLAMIDAMPGHGKTWLALSLAYAVAAGTPLLGWTNERKAKVLYVDGELPGELLQRRIGLLGPALADMHFRLLAYAQFAARSDMMIDLGTDAGRAALDAEIETHQIDLIILDSVSTLVRSGMDNDVESWRGVQDWSLKHRARGRTVIFLHHHGRSGNPRGTSAREIVLDARIKITKDDSLANENETAFKLEFAKARDFFGADAAPLMAILSTQDGVVTWRREGVTDTRSEIAQLAEEGLTQTEIAKRLNMSPALVSLRLKEMGKSRKRGRPAKRSKPTPNETDTQPDNVLPFLGGDDQ
jgi:putative DNA primase/helicase